MDNIIALLKEFLNSEWLFYALYVYLFLLVFYCVYSAMNYFKYHSRMQKTLLSIYTQMTDKEKNRAQEEKQQRAVHGQGLKKDFLSSIDEELAYSGIKQSIPWLTTELYILITVGIAVIIGIVVTVIGTWYLGIASIVMIMLFFNVVISMMANKREQETEKIMIQFMNIVDNFSKTSDDLITILDRTAKYVDEPLGSIIYESVVEARNTGDSMLALQDLQDKVKNPHFKVLMRNLEIASRFETNYSDIIDDCREIYHDYLRSEKEKRAMRSSGLLEILIMIVTGGLCVYIIGDVTDSGNIFTTLMNGGVAGIAILCALIGSVVIALYIGIFQIMKKN